MIEASSRDDPTEHGLRRSRTGVVGGAEMMVQVAVSGHEVNTLAEVLFLFWSLEDGHQRRLLVTGMGDVWMETGRGGAVRIGSQQQVFRQDRRHLEGAGKLKGNKHETLRDRRVSPAAAGDKLEQPKQHGKPKTWVALNAEPARALEYRIVRIWGGSRLLVRGWAGQ